MAKTTMFLSVFIWPLHYSFKISLSCNFGIRKVRQAKLELCQ